MEYSINKILNVKSNYKNYLEFRCPSCGNKCLIGDDLCVTCKFNLKDFKKIIFAKYELLNKAHQNAINEKYFEAYTEIVEFLSFYKESVDAYKLKIYLLVKLGQLDLAKIELQQFEKMFPRNLWLMEFENVEYATLPKFDVVNGTKEYYSNIDSFSEILEAILLISNVFNFPIT